MSISDRYHDEPKKFAGYPITNAYDMSSGAITEPPEKFAHRVITEFEAEQDLQTVLTHFLNNVDPAKIHALYINEWDSMYESGPDDAIKVLVQHAKQLSNLKHIAFGIVSSDVCEVSWIYQGNYDPFFEAFPQLETFHIRGVTDLVLSSRTFAHLKTLIVESGGMGVNILKAIAESKFPSLEHASLWIGTEEYGWDGTPEECAEYIAHFVSHAPKLQHIEIANCECINELLPLLMQQDWISKIPNISFAGGTLKDEAAELLLSTPSLSSVQHLDLSHHYLTEEMSNRLKQHFGDRIDVSDPQDPEEEWCYTLIGE